MGAVTPTPDPQLQQQLLGTITIKAPTESGDCIEDVTLLSKSE